MMELVLGRTISYENRRNVFRRKGKKTPETQQTNMTQHGSSTRWPLGVPLDCLI